MSGKRFVMLSSESCRFVREARLDCLFLLLCMDQWVRPLVPLPFISIVDQRLF